MRVEIVSSEALAQISGVGLLRVDVALVGWGWWVGGLGGARFLMERLAQIKFEPINLDSWRRGTIWLYYERGSLIKSS